jgi:hypothetical protein
MAGTNSLFAFTSIKLKARNDVPPNNVLQPTACGAHDLDNFEAFLCGVPRRRLNTRRYASRVVTVEKGVYVRSD